MSFRTIALIISTTALVFMLGCTLTTTVVVEEDYAVRIVNRSGQRVGVRWADDSYRYLDDDQVIYVPADNGYYELEWGEVSSRSRTRPSKVHIFNVTVSMDIDIVFREGPDIIIIER